MARKPPNPKKGNPEKEGYNEAPVIVGNKKVWFLNGDLVRVHHINRSNGIMSVYNITKDQIESFLVSNDLVIEDLEIAHKAAEEAGKKCGRGSQLW